MHRVWDHNNDIYPCIRPLAWMEELNNCKHDPSIIIEQNANLELEVQLFLHLVHLFLRLCTHGHYPHLLRLELLKQLIELLEVLLQGGKEEKLQTGTRRQSNFVVLLASNLKVRGYCFTHFCANFFVMTVDSTGQTISLSLRRRPILSFIYIPRMRHMH